MVTAKNSEKNEKIQNSHVSSALSGWWHSLNICALNAEGAAGAAECGQWELMKCMRSAKITPVCGIYNMYLNVRNNRVKELAKCIHFLSFFFEIRFKLDCIRNFRCKSMFTKSPENQADQTTNNQHEICKNIASLNHFTLTVPPTFVSIANALNLTAIPTFNRSNRKAFKNRKESFSQPHTCTLSPPGLYLSQSSRNSSFKDQTEYQASGHRLAYQPRWIFGELSLMIFAFFLLKMPICINWIRFSNEIFVILSNCRSHFLHRPSKWS